MRSIALGFATEYALTLVEKSDTIMAPEDIVAAAKVFLDFLASDDTAPTTDPNAVPMDGGNTPEPQSQTASFEEVFGHAPDPAPMQDSAPDPTPVPVQIDPPQPAPPAPPPAPVPEQPAPATDPAQPPAGV
jgi:hypothetical protein